VFQTDSAANFLARDHSRDKRREATMRLQSPASSCLTKTSAHQTTRTLSCNKSDVTHKAIHKSVWWLKFKMTLIATISCQFCQKRMDLLK